MEWEEAGLVCEISVPLRPPRGEDAALQAAGQGRAVNSMPPMVPAPGTPPRRADAGGAVAVLRALLLAGIIVPALLLVVGGWIAWRSHQNASVAYLRQTAEIMTEHAVRVFETHRLVAANVDRVLAGRDAEAARADEAMLNCRAARPRPVASAGAGHLGARPGGRPWVSANVHPMPPLDLSDREYFRRARDDGGGLYVSEILRGRAMDGAVFFQLSSARRAPDGSFAGVVAVSGSRTTSPASSPGCPARRHGRHHRRPPDPGGWRDPGAPSRRQRAWRARAGRQRLLRRGPRPAGQRLLRRGRPA
jgi:hypothetical protein